MKTEPGTLCAGCHAETDSLAHGAKVPHPAMDAMTCGECHAPHASRQPKLLREAEATICAKCHDEPQPKPGDKFVHAPFGDGACGACHGVHGGDNAKLLKAEGRALCLGCHTQVALAEKAPVVHAGFLDSDCLTCHAAHHGTRGRRDSRATPAEVCGSCHSDVISKAAVEAAFHQPVKDAQCTACHKGHASKEPGLLIGQRAGNLPLLPRERSARRWTAAWPIPRCATAPASTATRPTDRNRRAC